MARNFTFINSLACKRAQRREIKIIIFSQQFREISDRCSDTNMNVLDYVPKLGMKFDSVEDAHQFWDNYAARTGFCFRKNYGHNNIKDGLPSNVVFVCNKAGKRREKNSTMAKQRERAETKIDCKVKYAIHRKCGKYQVYDLCLEHNHLLHTADTIHMMPSQRHISETAAHEIENADVSGISVRRSHDFMSRRAGGVECIGFTELDHRNFLRTKRQRDLKYGDAGSILSYFSAKAKENPFFYYDMQLDCEEHITNMFWADAKMRIDFGLFGDVVSFDTTYSTNRETRPFGVFVGLNHHRSTVIFGAAVMYDETAASFEWLFQSFLSCHNQKHPKTVFTDQDPAMAKAIRNVFRDTYHGLCTFHIMLNGIRHLGHLMKDGNCFLTHFKKCMFDYSSEEEFESAWSTMLHKFYVQGNKWLLSIYSVKEKWASCYMKNVYSLGIRSTQLSESCNAELKRVMKCSLSMIKFFKAFEEVVRSKCYRNLKLEYESREKQPMVNNKYCPYSRQLCNIYTPEIFRLFQLEISAASAYIRKSDNEQTNRYILESFIDGEKAVVIFDRAAEELLCSCLKFQSWGFLCKHAIRVLNLCCILEIPKKYVLSRWTRAVISEQVEDCNGVDIKEDIHLDVTERYRYLCPKLVRLADYAAQSKEGFEFLLSQVNPLMKVVDFKSKANISNSYISNSAPLTCYQGQEVKGLAKKIKLPISDKRLKPWMELQEKKKTNAVKRNKPEDRDRKESSNLKSLGYFNSQDVMDN